MSIFNLTIPKLVATSDLKNRHTFIYLKIQAGKPFIALASGYFALQQPVLRRGGGLTFPIRKKQQKHKKTKNNKKEPKAQNWKPARTAQARKNRSVKTFLMRGSYFRTTEDDIRAK